MKSFLVMAAFFVSANSYAYKACTSEQWGQANDACESKCGDLGFGSCHYATSCGIGIFGGGHADCSCGGMATYGGPQAGGSVAGVKLDKGENTTMPTQANPRLAQLKAKLDARIAGTNTGPGRHVKGIK